MYRTALLTILLAVLALVAADLAIRFTRRGKPAGDPHPAPFRVVRIIVNAAGLLSLVAAAITGFSAVLTPTSEMTGDLLLRHVTFAPAFAITAVAVALLWAHKSRFTSGDALPVTLRKLFFWSAVVLAVPTMLSILAAMFPVFGTSDQQELSRIHRYCAPLLVASGLLFAYFAMVTRRERSPE